MHRIRVQNMSNATLWIKARVVDSVKKYPVESHYHVLPKTTKELSALHFFLEDLPAGLKLLWQVKDDPEPAATKAAPPPQLTQPVASPQPAVSSAEDADAQDSTPKPISGFGGHNRKGARE